MTKRDFFILVIKLFGLLALVNSIFMLLPTSFSYILGHWDAVTLLWGLIVSLVVFGLYFLLLRRSAWLVRVLKLEQGFDEERIDLGSLRAEEIVKIATFIIGGLILINNLPVFLNNLYNVIHREFSQFLAGPDDKSLLIISSIKLVVGYFLLTNYAYIANVFNRNNKNHGSESI